MVKQNLFKKIIIIIAFITISISSFLVSVSLADEPCEDKPTTGKYSCYDMANKLGLCEKSEHVRALCPKSCKACPNDSAGANAAPSTPAPAKESSTSKENESAQLEMLKNQHVFISSSMKSDIYFFSRLYWFGGRWPYSSTRGTTCRSKSNSKFKCFQASRY